MAASGSGKQACRCSYERLSDRNRAESEGNTQMMGNVLERLISITKDHDWILNDLDICARVADNDPMQAAYSWQPVW